MSRTDLIMSAVAEPSRRQLLELLHQRDEFTVSELVEATGLRQPQVSKHLKVLANAELVTARAEGKHRHYRLEGRGLQTAHDWFASFEDVWLARFDALDQLVSSDSQPNASKEP